MLRPRISTVLQKRLKRKIPTIEKLHLHSSSTSLDQIDVVTHLLLTIVALHETKRQVLKLLAGIKTNQASVPSPQVAIR